MFCKRREDERIPECYNLRMALRACLADSVNARCQLVSQVLAVPLVLLPILNRSHALRAKPGPGTWTGKKAD